MFRKKNIEITNVRIGGYVLSGDTIIAVRNKTELCIVAADVQENFDLTFEVLSVYALQSGQFILGGYDKFQKGHLNVGVSLGKVTDGHTFSTISDVREAGLWGRNVSMSPIVIENSLYDFKSNKIAWSVQRNAFFYFVNGLLFSLSKGYSVSKVNLNDGSAEWSFEKRFDPWRSYDGREKATEVANFIGVENNRLWLALTNGGILVLDANTGNEIVNLDLSGTFKSQKPYPFTDISTLHLDAPNNVIIGLKVRGYLEIDTLGLKASYLNLTEEFSSHELTCSSGNRGAAGDIVFDSDYIYFIDKENFKVGALERISRKISWQFSFRSAYGNAMPMNVMIGKSILTVLDSKGQLHVFERSK